MAQITSYYEKTPINVAINRVFNLEDLHTTNSPISYEWHIGTVMNTVLCHYFTSDDWAVTPEQIQEETNQKPDFVVEKVKTVNDRFWLFPHIYVEIKKDTEAGFIQAMNQVVETIGPRVGRSDTKSSFVILAGAEPRKAYCLLSLFP